MNTMRNRLPNGRNLSYLLLAAAAIAIAASAALWLMVQRSDGLPPLVPLQQWQAETHLGSAGEARLVAEVDVATQLTLAIDGRNAFVLPLIGTDGAEQIVRGALVYPGRERLDEAALDALVAKTVATGVQGPVVELSGIVGGSGAFRAPLVTELTALGREMTSDLVLMRPAELPAPAPSLPVEWAVASFITGIALVFIATKIRMPFFSVAGPAAPTGRHHRIAPYVPTMATGEDGRAALRQVLRPGADTVVRVAPVSMPARPAKSTPVMAAGKATRSASIFHRGRGARSVASDLRPVSASSSATAALLAAARFGGDDSGVELSRRATARLNADPFVKRLRSLR